MTDTEQKLQFHPEVEPFHLRVDADRWEDIIVVGDLHGCARELEDLLKRLDPNSDELVVFVGDLISKGPSSDRVVEIVRSRNNFTSVRGNNEQKAIAGQKKATGLSEENRSYLKTLPVVITWKQSMVVHGGIDPEKELIDHDVKDLVTFRSVDGKGYQGTFWFEKYEGPPRVFFGHTVLAEPVVTDSVVGLDTGCVYGGSLSAYRCSTGEITTVPARQTVQERDDKYIISPDDIDTR